MKEKIQLNEHLVIRIVKFRTSKYLAIMEETLANMECPPEKYYFQHYNILCDHILYDKEVPLEHISISKDAEMCQEDTFTKPTMDEYIKLGILLRYNHKRFNKKKSLIIRK